MIDNKQKRKQPDISVVIPTYNESKHIEISLKSLYDFLRLNKYSFEIIIVDDGSKDKTKDIVQNIMKTLPEIYLLKLAQNSGKGHAIREGVLYARGKYVFFTDSDMVITLSTIKECIDKLIQGNCDIVIGNRRSNKSTAIGQSHISRRIISNIFITFTRCILISEIYDTQCPCKGFRSEVINDLFSEQIINSFAFDVEVLYRAIKQGYTIRQIPVTWFDKRAHLPLPKLLKILILAMIDVVRIKQYFIRKNSID